MDFIDSFLAQYFEIIPMNNDISITHKILNHLILKEYTNTDTNNKDLYNEILNHDQFTPTIENCELLLFKTYWLTLNNYQGSLEPIFVIIENKFNYF